MERDADPVFNILRLVGLTNHLGRTNPNVAAVEGNCRSLGAKIFQARMRCKTFISEEELVAIAQDALNIRIKKKIEGEIFHDLYELSKRATRYEALLRATMYHLDIAPLEVDMEKFIKGETFTYDPLIK